MLLLLLPFNLGGARPFLSFPEKAILLYSTCDHLQRMSKWKKCCFCCFIRPDSRMKKINKWPTSLLHSHEEFVPKPSKTYIFNELARRIDKRFSGLFLYKTQIQWISKSIIYYIISTWSKNVGPLFTKIART